jgi:cytochrome c-type biogenesis protein CcmH
MADQIEMMIGKLAERLQQNPDDAEGWVMLGRSYSALRRYKEAVKAFEKAAPLAGENAAVLADYADAMAMATDKKLNGKPMQLLEKALSIDPDNKKALWLAGTGLFELGDFAGAINYWQRLSDTLSPDSEDRQVMENNIAEARSYRKRQLAGELGAVPATSQASQKTASAQALAKAKITGTVSLSANLEDKTSPSDTLFVFARAVSGRPIPLAIIRTQVSDLPMQFTLDESQAMTPTLSLANFDQVVVGARISKTGEALPQSGDLQGLIQDVAVGSDGLEIIIDSVVP